MPTQTPISSVLTARLCANAVATKAGTKTATSNPYAQRHERNYGAVLSAPFFASFVKEIFLDHQPPCALNLLWPPGSKGGPCTSDVRSYFCYFAFLLFTDRDNMKYSEQLDNK